MAGTLLPWLTEQFLDNSGNPLASGTVDFYAAGTSTRQTTYSDSALTTANANPVVLDSAGRATIYLDPSLTYKAVIKDSVGATIRTVDNIIPIGYSAGLTCEGRLTLTTGTPVSGDVTSGTTLYFTPYKGNRISLYTGTAWTTLTFTEKSITLVGLTASKNYDVWGYLDANGALALELLVWTSDSARATALTTQDGVYVKSGDATRRYLGTIRTTTGGGAVTDSVLLRGVWNYYHRVRRALRVKEATDSWTYTTAAWRITNGASANLVAAVIGVAEALIDLRAQAAATNASACNIATGIGEDSSTAPASEVIGMAGYIPAGGVGVGCAFLQKAPTAGYHDYRWLEFSQAAGTTTWQGDVSASVAVQSGLSGSIEG